MRQLHQSFSAGFTYPVLFTRGIFGKGAAAWDAAVPDAGPHRVLFFIDEGICRAFPAFLEEAEAFFTRSGKFILPLPPRILPGGEPVKNDYRLTMEIVDTLLECRLCRHSLVIAAGGGAVLDAAGFAASIVHRGIRLVRLPSTVLAQDDAGLGVKNGMNLHGGKNTIGTFAPPAAVINDLDLLDGLDDTGWRDGLSEAFKVALLKDAAFFDRLTALAPRLAARDREAMEETVFHCARLHLEHIAGSGDPFELGSSRPLDFGHWSAHKLESLSGYRVTHGSAVAFGIALDACISVRAGWCEPVVRDRLLQALRTCGFPLWYPEAALQDGAGRHLLLEGLEEFREHLGGRLTLSMPGRPGVPVTAHRLDPDQVTAALRELEQASLTRP